MTLLNNSNKHMASKLAVQHKKKSRASGFFFCTLHSSLFTPCFSLNLPRDFSGEEIREKREKKRQLFSLWSKSIDFQLKCDIMISKRCEDIEQPIISKLHISLKETGESIYWLTLLKRTNIIVYDFDKLLSLAEEIKRMLIASLNTAKSSQENK